jgi:hypothetical protein
MRRARRRVTSARSGCSRCGHTPERARLCVHVSRVHTGVLTMSDLCQRVVATIAGMAALGGSSRP